MLIIHKADNRTPDSIAVKNPYASGYSVRAVEIPQSTSADGWKYHKRNKRKKL